MIKQKTARAMLYDWHGGQWTAIYAAASSGLVKNFEALLLEVKTITFEPDRDKLIEYLLYQHSKARYVCQGDRNDPEDYFFELPWAN